MTSTSGSEKITQVCRNGKDCSSIATRVMKLIINDFGTIHVSLCNTCFKKIGEL